MSLKLERQKSRQDNGFFPISQNKKLFYRSIYSSIKPRSWNFQMNRKRKMFYIRNYFSSQSHFVIVIYPRTKQLNFWNNRFFVYTKFLRKLRIDSLMDTKFFKMCLYITNDFLLWQKKNASGNWQVIQLFFGIRR